MKLYVPGSSPEITVVVPAPAIPPGFIVQEPDGRPLSATLPVAVLQSGCVIVPATGAPGSDGAADITTFPEGSDVHPTEFLTEKV